MTPTSTPRSYLLLLKTSCNNPCFYSDLWILFLLSCTVHSPGTTQEFHKKWNSCMNSASRLRKLVLSALQGKRLQLCYRKPVALWCTAQEAIFTEFLTLCFWRALQNIKSTNNLQNKPLIWILFCFFLSFFSGFHRNSQQDVSKMLIPVIKMFLLYMVLCLIFHTHVAQLTTGTMRALMTTAAPVWDVLPLQTTPQCRTTRMMESQSVSPQ